MHRLRPLKHAVIASHPLEAIPNTNLTRLKRIVAEGLKHRVGPLPLLFVIHVNYLHSLTLLFPVAGA